MYFSYEWLSELIDKIPQPEELMDKLTRSSVEVEDIIQSEYEIGNVVIGEVLEITKHPDADKLNVGKFDVGEEQPRQIVFGGVAELNVGDKLPIALAPTTITGGAKIKRVKLRGQESQGMCCLNSELGIYDKLPAVQLFEKNVKNGTPLIDLLPKGDVLIDIDNKSMTHRADLFCHNNMAREIAAVFNTKVKIPEYKNAPEVKNTVNVKIEDKKACSRYIGTELKVTVQPAPTFIVDRLQQCGVKSINNVVDITNYVMLEMGEPMHAFDKDKLAKEQIIVRKAKKGESIKTLDNDEKELDESMLIIADAEKPIAVAGIIGGVESSVTEQTKHIILEAANFEPIGVRKTTKKINCRTESAVRWEKGLPVELAEYATTRVIELLVEYADAEVVAITDVGSEKETKCPEIQLSAAFLSRLTGITIPNKEVEQILKRLNCQVKNVGKADELIYKITPPWFRRDLAIPEDLVEEIVRLYGIENIQEQKVTGELDVPKQEVGLAVIDKVRMQLTALGAFEVSNYSFYGEQLIEKCGLRTDKEHIEIMNPLSDDLKYLRASVLPRLLENVAYNQRYKDQAAFFEVGHVYYSDREVKQLGIIAYGRKEPYRYVRSLVEELLSSLHIDYQVEITEKTVPCEFWGMYEQNQALLFKSGDDILCTIGQVDDVITKNMKISGLVGFAAISVSNITQNYQVTSSIDAISAYPAIPLDLSIIINEQVSWGDVEKELYQYGGNIIKSIEVFDVYRGDKIDSDKKSIAFHIVLQSDERTLEMQEVEKWRDNLLQKLAKSTGAILRDK